MEKPEEFDVPIRTFQYFLRVHPDGYLEHFESNLVTTSIYYEAMYVERILSRSLVSHRCWCSVGRTCHKWTPHPISRRQTGLRCH